MEINRLILREEQWTLLQKWAGALQEINAGVNLISRKDPAGIWEKHLLHCLALLTLREIPEGSEVCDFGTGGGLPGVLLAVARPDYIRILSMVLYSEEVWELPGIGELIWTTAANNLGPTVEDYVKAHPERGLEPVMQTAMGVFGACLARCITGWESAAIPDGTDALAWRRGWRDRMTAIWMRVMFG